jgi:hypothetical protein
MQFYLNLNALNQQKNAKKTALITKFSDFLF